MGKMSPDVVKHTSQEQCCVEKQYAEFWKMGSVLEKNKKRIPVFLEAVYFLHYV
jgi:hypothetical protein